MNNNNKQIFVWLLSIFIRKTKIYNRNIILLFIYKLIINLYYNNLV